MRTVVTTMSIGSPQQVQWWIDSKGPPSILICDDGRVLWCEADANIVCYELATKTKLVLDRINFTATRVIDEDTQ